MNKTYIIDVEGRKNYMALLRQLKKRKNTLILSHGEYYFGGQTDYYQIVILTGNLGKLSNSSLIYGMVERSKGDLKWIDVQNS